MHLVWCICLMPFQWSLRSKHHKLPPCLRLSMKICRNPLSFIVNAILLFQPSFKLCLCTKPVNPFNWSRNEWTNKCTNEYNNLHSSIHVPSSSVIWPKLQIHERCLLRCPTFSEPRIRVAIWRSSMWSCGRSGPSGIACRIFRNASRAML